MIPRFLNVQGAVGVATSLALAVLLLVQKVETRHWKKQSASFEQLYQQEQSALAGTVANYRAAAEAARAADKANAGRVASAQSAINERIEHDFEVRLAAARADAQRLRIQSDSAANSRPGGGSPMSGLSAPSGGAVESASEDGFSSEDALKATEQAIQLDELIKWVRQQHAVRVDGVSGERPQAADAQAKVDNSTPTATSPPND
jgi:hypothetical protein